MSNILKNTFIYTLGNVIPKIVGFVLLPIYTQYLTPSDYGIISSVQALVPILIILFSMSFDASIFRLYWDYNNEEERRVFFGTIFISTSFISFIFFLLILIFQRYVEEIYSSVSFYPYFFYVVVTVLISNSFLLPKKFLMLKDKAFQFISLTLFQFVINVGLILLFIIWRNEGAEGYLKAGMIASLTMFLPFFFITLRIIKLKFSKSIFKNIFNYSLPLIPTLLSAWIIDLSNRIFIERYFTLEEVGIYSLAFKIASIILIVVTAFNKAYRPAFFKLANSGNLQESKINIYKYNYIFTISFMLFGFFVIFFSKEVIILLFDIRYRSALLYIPLIAFAYLFSVAGGMVNRFFEQSKKTKDNMFIVIGMAILNLILNYLLIPSFGAYGAAVATIISLFLGFVVKYLYARKKCFFVPFNWKMILPIGISLIFIFIIFQYIIIIDNIYISLLWKSLVTLALGVLLLIKYSNEVKYVFKKM